MSLCLYLPRKNKTRKNKNKQWGGKLARARSPQREAAKKEFISSGGKIKTKDLAVKIGVNESQIRKWKSLDKWTSCIHKKRGAPYGNKNAVGNGAPLRNNNAETHGAYTTVYLDSLSEEDKKYVLEISDRDTQGKMLAELQLLIAKESDLKRRILYLQQGDGVEENLYIDKVIKADNGEGEPTTTTIKGSAFYRQLKLESELNKVHGRIIKLLDSIKSYELETRRIDLEYKRYRLTKQRITGEFNINDETGEIDDETDDESDLEKP